jgi:hypothetical protein
MFRKLALLTVALTLTIPSVADTPSDPGQPNAATPHHKQKNKNNVETLGFSNGAANPVTPQGAATAGRASKINPGEANLNSAGRVLEKPRPKNPPVKNPCKGPNPPHDCQQAKPPH